MASQNGTYIKLVFAVGFANGIVRFLQVTNAGIRLIKSLKVHKEAISHLKFSPLNNIICVISVAGDIFFLSFDETKLGNVTPYCFFETQQSINSLCWSAKQVKIIVGTKSGTILEIDVP